MNENQNLHHAQPVRTQKSGGNNTVLIVILVIIAVAGLAFYLKPWERFMSPASAPASATGSQSQTPESLDAIAALSKIYEVPVGDEPILYTIDDAQALIAQQAFFTGAQNGDTLFIFPQNMKAVIFSQARNKVINAGPLSYQGDGNPAATGIDPTVPFEGE
ncbi:hypothetical protein A3C87_03960 [Candidatus Kaiserbacteria bacterium RIFCSPHIGHO2_02_FULL_49_34]|uniref:Uncharacterized protein n=1 Tax=Candidatus Kaiserbacteria bacterium RIFCSPHIGHO2_02_FULL_49_34 TaxID=1798491 RepID=A0A1F6DNL8_9BACT|nr:MAG: hypothetical protein A3C87_03960 [Candidatus Kaiserbacteria bacterium RIFCSPHIGHO2_02_FULL_49_34]